MSSDAVSIQRVSKVVGYKLTTGDFSESSPNLPQRIALLAEANTDNQATLDLTPFQITTAQQAGERYGWGSPIYTNARILIPVNGGGVNGVPVIVYPQAQAVGATAKILGITPSGTATGNGTHTLIVSGRDNIDGQFYNININAGDTVAVISGKIADALNNILACPGIATHDSYGVNFTSKWKGLTADKLVIRVDTGNDTLGITYVVSNIQSGSGTPSIQAALNLFGNDWITIVLNSYGTHAQTLTLLELFNGKPDPINPTGRFAATVQKPFQAFAGTTDEDPSAISNARLNEVTNILAVAPLSEGLPMEAAACWCVNAAIIGQNTPHLDVSGMRLTDMPTPVFIGAMSNYDNRDVIVKKGCSTVDLVAGEYVIMDAVTTYHKLGENPPQFRYLRIMVIDANVRFAYFLLEQTYVVDHAIAADTDTVYAEKVIKPKQWSQQVDTLADDLAKRALITEPEFMQKSKKVGLSTVNPDRLETFFKYKRSGYVRQASTTAEAGFNFGTPQ
jgi:phage tail sheath gpL-like